MFGQGSKGKMQVVFTPKASSYKAPLDLSTLLAHDKQRERFQTHFQRRKLITPKYGRLGNFDEFLFPEMLKSQSIYDFSMDYGPYYPNLVKAFFCNLKAKSYGFKTWVKGVSIKVSLPLLSEILDIPNEGERIHPEYVAGWEGYKKKDFFLSMCRYSEEEIINRKQRTGVASSNRNIYSVHHLTTDDRILHYLLCYVLVPKASNYTQINDFEMQLLYAIKNDIPINWASVFVNHLLNHIDRSGQLPYGRQISRILEYFNVDTSDQQVIDMNINENQIGRDLLHKLGIQWDASEHVYRHRRDLIEAQLAEESAESSNVQGVTHQMILTELRCFRDFVTTKFAELGAKTDYPDPIYVDDMQED